MKIVQINSVFGKASTGKICLGISEKLTESGLENYVLYSGAGIDHPVGVKYTDRQRTRSQAFRSRVLGNFGFNSVKETQDLIAKLEALAPDLVHIHNLHSHDCHLGMLLSYLKEQKIKTVWTFHDCWCFTGYCTYFDAVHCDRWKQQCHDCPQRKGYSWFFDRSARLYDMKKAAFEGLDLTVVTPSKWLADLVKASFLRGVPVKVIHNGINLSLFAPVDTATTAIRSTPDERIVLGVAMGWEARKGLDVFVSLAERLPSNYKIVLVGTDDAVDQRLPENIRSIHRTHSQQELAALYAAADVFVNPTREDNFPTVNIEALACGTPVITFQTGGSPESIDETSGTVVACDDVDALEKEIIRACEERPYTQEACVARAKNFDQNERFAEYVELYKALL